MILKKLNRHLEEALCVLLLCIQLATLLLQILLRTLGWFFQNIFDINFPIQAFWTLEFCTFLFVYIGFLAISLGIRDGLHVRIELIASKLSVRMQNILEIVQYLAVAFVLVILIKYGWAYALKKTSHDMTSLPWSQFWLYAPLPVISILMMFRLFGRFYDILTHFNRPIFQSESQASDDPKQYGRM